MDVIVLCSVAQTRARVSQGFKPEDPTTAGGRTPTKSQRTRKRARCCSEFAAGLKTLTPTTTEEENPTKLAKRERERERERERAVSYTHLRAHETG